MQAVDETRRRFLACMAGLGLGSTLAPGILWARMQEAGARTVTAAMVTDALKLAGIDVTDEEAGEIVESANRSLTQLEELRAIHVPNDVSPPFHFSSVVPGIEVDRTARPFRMSEAPIVERPTDLEDVAFWPVRHLAELVRTQQVTSIELTEMYLARLRRYNPVLNNVVTFLDDYGLAEARRADEEIAAGRYRGPLHGIPWGAKDIISVKGYRTTWGSPAFEDQVFDYDASIVEMLRDAGAVLIAKLTTGELAAGDRWFGGQTKSPWDPAHGSSGSSAGPGSATAAGCVGFAIGTETSGSILSPSARCGLAGLRPTFGRISRYGVMALSWTMDRLGPMCRYAEDCALVMEAIAKPDGRDMSVSDAPFHWDAGLDVRTLRVGYIKESFDGLTNDAARANAGAMLDTLRELGVSDFVPMTVPEITTNTSAINVEMAVYFDEHARSGRMDKARGGRRPGSRLMPAVDYLRGQRIRMMMMMELAQATEGLDVWVVASNNTGVGPPPRPEGEPTPPPPPPGPPQPQGPAQRHSSMANLACYPAINVPNGFADTGTPTNATFFARPFREEPLIALARAYQDRAGFHLRRPARLEEAAMAAFFAPAARW
jgi:Asp-tRNA(Asn)/Glu-tRNA(Gln) amidotransferase A subunit family amidase